MHAHAYLAAARFVATLPYITRMLGSPPVVGMALIERYFSGMEWVSVQEIAEQTGISEDTVRRRLAELVNTNRAKVREEAGRHRYAANGRFAECLMRQVAKREPQLRKVPG